MKSKCSVFAIRFRLNPRKWFALLAVVLVWGMTAAAQANIEFGAADFNVNENGVASLTVKRSGNTSATSRVSYATNDSFAFTDFNANGPSANQRCDYNVSRRALNFAPGEISKTIARSLN